MSRGGARPGAGGPRKPTEQKRRLGNPGHRPLPAPLVVLPPAPLDELRAQHSDSPASQAMFDALMNSQAVIWIGQTDVLAVEVARRTWVDWSAARERWLSSPGDKDLFNAYNELNKRMTACLSQLGLDPVARARLGVAEVHRKTALDALEEKRAARRAGRPGG